MALRVWLPLNGNLENKGISGVELIQKTAPTYINNGKIGKALSAGAFTLSAIDTASILNNEEISFCFWIYPNAETGDTTNRAMIFGNNGMTAPNNRKFSIFQYPTCNDLHLSWQNDVTNTTFLGGVWNGVFPSYVWTHCAITYSKTQGKATIYINGEQYATANGISNSPSFEFETYLMSNGGTFRYLNDYRIYDHCLSPKEVKEISQGLVLHYKLDGWSGGSGENLLTGTSSILQSKTIGQYYATLGQESASFWGLNTNDTATYRLYLKAPTDKKVRARIQFFNSDSDRIQLQGNYINAGQEGYSTITWTMSSTQRAYSKMQLFVDCNDGTTNDNTFYYKEIKLEKGSTATAWSPAPAEIGIDTTKIKDSSGYENDGTATGNLIVKDNSIRHNNSIYFNHGNSSYIISPTLNLPGDKITMNIWIKSSNKTPAGDYHMPFEAYPDGSYLEMSIHKNGYLRGGIYVNSTRYVDNCTSTKLLDGNWHMITMTYDGTIIKRYVDAVMEKSTSVSGVMNAKTEGFIIGHYGNNTTYANVEMEESDLRVYTTALSADDILDLYHIPTNIDNLGNLHTFELTEQSGNLLAGSFFGGTMTYDTANKYYTITSGTNTSTWGIGPNIGTSPQKVIPWGKAYIFSYEVYTPMAGTWMIDYNNYGIGEELTGNDNDNSRLTTSYSVPANKWTLITHGCANTNSTKNPNHVPLYDGSTGIGPVMNNQSAAITWHMRNPQWYLVDADALPHIYKNGIAQGNALAEGELNNFTSFKNQEKRIEAAGFIEK